jgi:ferrochelatase
MKTGVILANLGTPDSPSTGDVRKYLRQFLMDGRVIDIPLAARTLLVNGIIAPFRAPKSAAVYKKVWLTEGSPLKVYGFALEKKVAAILGKDFIVRLGMRYQKPALTDILDEMKKEQVEKIVVIPLFPQYASATTGSVYEAVSRHIIGWQTIPSLSLAGTFFNADFFLEPVAKGLKDALSQKKYDQVLFTYHGLPERHIRKGDDTKKCLQGNCCDTLHPGNALCYRAQCFATSRLLADLAGLEPSQYTTSFQSRLGRDPWIKPYTDEKIRSWPGQGIHSVLALSPSFVADCLETTEEIGEEYRELFLESGGKTWDLIPCLNDDQDWAAGLAAWIRTFTS